MAATTTNVIPKCRICGHSDHWLGDHIIEAHDLTVEEYLTAYPGSPTASQELLDQYEAQFGSRVRRSHPPTETDLSVSFCGLPLPVNHDVPEDACLPLPPAYRAPEHGKLARDIGEAVIAFACHRSTYIHGLPGSGKDAVVHAYSAVTRTPAMMFASGFSSAPSTPREPTGRRVPC